MTNRNEQYEQDIISNIRSYICLIKNINNNMF